MNVTSHTPDDGHETSTKPTFGKDVSADCTDSAEACDDSGGVEQDEWVADALTQRYVAHQTQRELEHKEHVEKVVGDKPRQLPSVL